MSKAELFAFVSSKRARGPSTSGAVGRSDFCSLASCQAGGGLTITIPPHLGQDRICPTAAGSRTRSRDLHVVHVIANRSMPAFDPIRRLRPPATHRPPSEWFVSGRQVK